MASNRNAGEGSSKADGKLADLKKYVIDAARVEILPMPGEKGARKTFGGYGYVEHALLHPKKRGRCRHRPSQCRSEDDGHKLVAVKKLTNLTHIDPERLKRRFLREMLPWVEGKHENIVEFQGFRLDVERKDAWLICPWKRGGSVLDHLRAKSVGAAERLRLIQDTVEGLVWLHSHGICHGDIKGENVLVSDIGRAQLCDFGLSAFVEESKAASLDTVTSGEFKGSIPWCSPELFTATECVRTLESDVWAWACLVLEIMTGKPPFHETEMICIGNVTGLINRIIAKETPTLPEELLQPDYDDLRNLMQWCWSYEPEARPTISQCLELLQPLVDAALPLTLPNLDTESSTSYPPLRSARSPHPPAGLFDGAIRKYIFSPASLRLLEDMDCTGRITKIDSKVVASGGFSDVKKGKLSSNGAPVAIKALRMSGMCSDDKVVDDALRLRLEKRWAREIHIWVDLRHPRILPLAGFASVDDRPCLLSPWCKNGNVLEYLSRHPSADRKALVLQVAEGLIYLHSREPAVVHADIKSLNIMINDSGDAFLCDFGLSKRYGVGSTGMTTSGHEHYTIRYAAAEVLLGGEASTKSDVFSFACLALEIMTDKYPFFTVPNNFAVSLRIQRGEMPLPADHLRLPADHPLWTLFRRCWSLNVERRPTMVEVYDELIGMGWSVPRRNSTWQSAIQYWDNLRRSFAKDTASSVV